MLRYVMAAQALRFFSLSKGTKLLYRRLGNRRGGQGSGHRIPEHYIARADDNLRRIEREGGIRDGQKTLELGTGWVHWEALFTRLFYDVETILFDVWDNRKFDTFHAFMRQLRAELRGSVDRPAHALEAAEALLDEVIRCDTFEAVYALLGFRYLIDAEGSLEAVPDASIDLIISSDVLEHVPATAVPQLMVEMNRILKPGGVASHQIVEADHLKIYDTTVHGKNYLRYSDRQWRAFFENGVQYINRIQHSEWLAWFRGAGFEVLVDEISDSQDIAGLKISPRFAGYSAEDLAAIVTHVLARKTG